MRISSQLALLVLAAAGCGGQPSRLPARTQGYAARMAAADEHSERAEVHRRAARRPDQVANPLNYQCGDRNMSDQLTSGGERLVPTVPCWDPTEEAAERHRVAAIRETKRAQEERRAAARLVEAEVAACRGISPDEIDHSPFAHKKAIAEVIPHANGGGTVRGVRIVFRPVVGLTAAWMEKAIACHRARFERLGEPPDYLSDDPTLVRGAVTAVSVHGGRIEVLVETRDEVAAHVALSRAEDLVRQRTAGR